MCRTYICPCIGAQISFTPYSWYKDIHKEFAQIQSNHTPIPPPSSPPFRSHYDELFGFLVPYFDRDVIRFPTPSYIWHNAPQISPVLLFPFSITHTPPRNQKQSIKRKEKNFFYRCLPFAKLRFPKKRTKREGRRGIWKWTTNQIVGASDEMVSHTRAVLTSATADKNYTMLLHVVTYVHKRRQKVSALNSLSSPTSYLPLLLLSLFLANPTQHSIQFNHIHPLCPPPLRSRKIQIEGLFSPASLPRCKLNTHLSPEYKPWPTFHYST